MGGLVAAFTSDRTGRWQIFVMRSDGMQVRQVTRDTTLAHNPVWSPKGSPIVFYAGSGKGNDRIFTVDSNGKHLAQLTHNNVNNIYPSWSADGKLILFCSNRDGANALFVMNADGTDPKKLNDRLAFFGRWSPEGQEVATIFGKYPHTAIGILPLIGIGMLGQDPDLNPVWITPGLSEP